MFGYKNFSKEISAVKTIFEDGDTLTQAEFASIRKKILSAIVLGSPFGQKKSFWSLRKEKVIRYIVSAVLGLSLVAGTAFASSSALPGDPLYPVKRATEKLQLSLAASEESKTNLQAEFAQKRLDELAKLSAKTSAGVETQGLGLKTPNLPQEGAASGTNVSGKNQNKPGRADGLKNSKNQQLELQTQAEAQAEVKSALGGLRRLREKLEANGNSKAANAVQANIQNLESSARTQNIIEQDASLEIIGNKNENHGLFGKPGAGNNGVNNRALSSPGN